MAVERFNVKLLTMAVYIQKPVTRVSEPVEQDYLFEQWVVGKFPPSQYCLIDWRSDKRAGDIYPRSNQKPDLVFSARQAGKKDYFAIECKWKEVIKGQSWEWAKSEQRNQYHEFADKMLMPVFIIAGIGGTPDHPAEVYIIPLTEIEKSIRLSQKKLVQYRRSDDSGMMSWDRQRRELK
ncbi:MAG: hypothetical protein JST75_05725 [Bacteroidetes bacterium]|nr:hypothetical protein [Bacteroidota bacterium]